ncbi:MAG: hypothetical protein KatS3mg085_781 [Candidatus Dojkabacteria bacterium]|nr:MAG: hypothetical protein KatS3mg085_781 [Candidatus Dojkabacteria bacterium]
MNYRFFFGVALVLITLGMVVFISNFSYRRDLMRTRNEDYESVTLSSSRLKQMINDEKETISEPIESLQKETLIESIEGAKTQVRQGNLIRVNYIGWRANDGVVFDQSFDRGDEGFTFRVGSGVIDGWSQGVLGMKVGEIRRLKIPSSLAYGESDAGELIPPNTDLIFDVELLEIVE